MRAILIRFITLCSLLAPTPALASDGGGGDSGGMSMSGGGASGSLNSATTKAVVKLLRRDFERCARLPEVYRFDCYRLTYKLAGDMLAGIPAYGEAYQAMQTVERAAEQTVQKYRDPNQKKLRRGFNTFTPVKPETVPQAKQETERALQQAETILLRAPESKQVHYARIAEAVNSNKVLLRSALLHLRPLRTAWQLLMAARPYPA